LAETQESIRARSRVNVVVVDAAAMVDPGAERALVRLVPFHVNLSPPNCPYCRAGRVTKRARPIDRGAANNLCPALSGAMTAVQHVNPVQSDAVVRRFAWARGSALEGEYGRFKYGGLPVLLRTLRRPRSTDLPSPTFSTQRTLRRRVASIPCLARVCRSQ